MMDWSAQAGNAPAAYESFLVPAMFAPFADRLVELVGVQAGSAVLDVACGTGVVSRAAARLAGSGGSVTGVDLGEPTLDVARSIPAEAGASPITYLQSDAGSLNVADAAFDIVVCQQGLQFFPDRERALAEMRRALRPAGHVAVATWTDLEHSPFSATADSLTVHIGQDAGQMLRSPFGLSNGQELEGLLLAAGFGEVVTSQESIECTWASHPDWARLAIGAGPVAQLFATAPEEAKRAVSEEVSARLAPYATSDGRLRMTMTTNIAVGRA
jgi:SAM-dependent methyltransferase